MWTDDFPFICFLCTGSNRCLTCRALHRLRHLLHAQRINGISDQREKLQRPVDLIRVNGCALRLHLGDFLLDFPGLKLSANRFQPPDIVSVLLIYRSGWMSSAYISAEARFMANFNERNLQREADSDSENQTEWLDEKLYVQQLSCPPEIYGKTLKQLSWGSHFNVNVIQVLRGRRVRNMPSGNLELHEGDRLILIGKADDFRSLRLSLNLPEQETLPTLRKYIAAQSDGPNDVYAYALRVHNDSELLGKSIRSSGLREKYDCMVLGLQRQNLPILQPDVNMTIQAGDLVWILGSRRMAEKLIAGGFGEGFGEEEFT